MHRLARLSRIRPPPLRVARCPPRLARGVATGPRPDLISVQRVHFEKPKRSLTRKLLRRALPLTIAIPPILALYIIAILSVIELEDDDEHEDGDGDGDEDEDEDEDDEEEVDSVVLLFIPLPFTQELRAQPEFPPGSPELAMFDKIKKDPKLTMKLRNKLGWLTYNAICTHREFVSKFGKPMRWESNFQLSYPSRPPAQWVQRGLAFTEDGILFAEQCPVDPYVTRMLPKVLWPVSAAKAHWKFYKAVAAYKLGFGSGAPQPSSPQNVSVSQNSGGNRAQALLPAKRQLPGGPTASPPAADLTKNDNTSAPGRSDEQGARDQSTEDPSASRKANATFWEWAREHMLPNKTPDGDEAPLPDPNHPMTRAKMQFLHDVLQVSRPKTRDPPPGCVRLGGFMNVYVKNRIVTFYVEAHYNPETEGFDRRSFSATHRGTTVRMSPG